MAYFLLPQRLNKNSKQLAGSLESILLFRQEEKEGRQRERGGVRQTDRQATVAFACGLLGSLLRRVLCLPFLVCR